MQDTLLGPSFSTTVLLQNDPPARTCWVTAYRVGDYSPCVSQVCLRRGGFWPTTLTTAVCNTQHPHPCRHARASAVHTQVAGTRCSQTDVATTACTNTNNGRQGGTVPLPHTQHTQSLAHNLVKYTHTQYTHTNTHSCVQHTGPSSHHSAASGTRLQNPWLVGMKVRAPLLASPSFTTSLRGPATADPAAASKAAK